MGRRGSKLYNCIVDGFTFKLCLGALVTITGRGNNKTVVYFSPLACVSRWGKVRGCWTCWLHGGWLTDTQRSERRLLPGTAFSTGLHPLKCRSSRHFCTRCRTVCQAYQYATKLHSHKQYFTTSSLSTLAGGSQSTCFQSERTSVELNDERDLTSGCCFKIK